MLIHRTAAWLFAWVALATMATGAWAQPPSNSNLTYQTAEPSWENGSAPFADDTPGPKHNFLPFHPMNFEPVADPFGPAETSGYGNGPRPHVGYWFSYERVFWSLAAPKKVDVGSPTAQGIFPDPIGVPQPFFNSADTGWITAGGAWGNRWEMGYIDTDNRGWMVSILDHVKQGQYKVIENGSIQFNDPVGLLDSNLFSIFGIQGQWPAKFLGLTMKNTATLNGVEVMRTYRAPRKHNGGFFELLYGARFLQLDDAFNVFGTNTIQTAEFNPLTGALINNTIIDLTNPLANARFDTRVLNNMIGPQIGGRWSNQRGRWISSVEARFTAAANFQNVHQTTSIASQLGGLSNFGYFSPLANIFYPLASNSRQFTTTFAPIGELRAQVAFQVWSNCALKVGYTGMVIGGISRASNRVDYTGPNLISIYNGRTDQIFFSNGVNFGVEFNR